MRFQTAGMSFFARDSRWISSNPTIGREVLKVLVLISAVIQDPLTAADGERGLSQETDLIRMLTDTNGDGKADQSTVFADGFNSLLDGIASGVLARRGEVWVTDIPSLWRFRSGNGDPLKDATPDSNVSDRLASSPKAMKGFVAEELQRGFGVRFSFTGHDLHGLKFGPDGRLCFSCGDRGARLLTQEGKTIDLADEGAVFRCEPDGSHLEVVHRGLRNPQELAFDEYGNLFTGDNDSDQGDRERWVLIQEGADSGWRVGHQHAPLGNAGMWNLERLWVPHFEGQAAYVMPPIVRAQAARLLGSSKLISATQGVASLTQDSSERVRLMALQALGDLLTNPSVGRANY
jgi:quinoprotein glucose dehydrogenase